ncbi:MAG TPA: hypothetical protein VES40_19490 [Ilumatobacteraceae bacterium]|nr:hypothetical protein [Ilumatobacteraceae bacterium]
MPSPTPPFDDEGDAAVNDVDRDEIRSDERVDARSRPHYWFRRAVVVGGVVALIATAAIVIVNLTNGSNGAATPGTVGAEWNRIVLVDERTGRVIVDNEQGEELARIDTGLRTVLDSAVVDSTAVVVSATATSVVDLVDETSTEHTISADSVTWPAGSGLTMIAADTDAARGLMIHGPSGDVIDTEAFDPIAGTRYEWSGARSSPSGRDVLVTDSGNFQSVLFSFDRDEPSYFPGLALAIDDDVVVTAQNVGTDATVNVFDHDGQAISSGATTSVRAAIIGGDAIALITVDGEIVTMSTASGDTKSTVRLALGPVEFGVVTTSGDRLVVVGADGSAIIDDTGAEIGSYPDVQLVPETWAVRGSRCIALADDTTEEVALVAFEDGSILNEAEMAAPLFSTVDGCTVASRAATGYQVTSPDEVAMVTVEDVGELVGLSPDGAKVVLEIGGRLTLADAATATDTIDFGPAGRTVGFTQQ